jgi:hypothetical protein
MKLKVPYFKQKAMTCGPSSLQQVMAYYGKKMKLGDIIKDIPMFMDGTYLAYLAKYAMEAGFKPLIITYNVDIFDPTWFRLSRKSLIKKLRSRSRIRKLDINIRRGCKSYVDYLESGGKLSFNFTTTEIIKKYLKKKRPIIVRLSSTILHDRKRLDLNKDKRDDISGSPGFHFVVVSGYKNGKFLIVDPQKKKYGGTRWVNEEFFLFTCLTALGDMLVLEGKR